MARPFPPYVHTCIIARSSINQLTRSSDTRECKQKSVGIFVQHANKKVPVIQVNRFRNQFFLVNAMSKVILGFSAVFNEMVQNTLFVSILLKVFRDNSMGGGWG